MILSGMTIKTKMNSFSFLKGTLYIDFRDGRTEKISPGEMIIVPKGR